MAYWPPYLKEIGFNSTEVGELVAAGLISRMLSPYVFGWLTDHTGKSVLIMWAASISGLIFFIAGIAYGQFLWLLVMIFLFGFFWGSLLSQTDALTLASLKYSSHQYSSIRLWGSIGFIVSVLGCVSLLERFGLSLIPIFIIVSCVLTCAIIPFIRERYRAPNLSAPIIGLLLRPEILILLTICFLVQLSHGPYYAFFTIYMRQHGHSHGVIGSLWTLAVFGEIVIFLLAHRVLPAFGAMNLLLWSTVITASRWLLTALFPDQLIVMLIAQPLHAVSFGIYHAAAMEFFHKWFPGRLQGRGQALYSSLSFGLGGAIGSFATGRLWDDWEGHVFLLATAVTLLATILCVVLSRLPPTKDMAYR